MKKKNQPKKTLAQYFKVQGYSGKSFKEGAEPIKGIPGEQLFCEPKESYIVLKAVKIIAMVKNLRQFVEYV